MLSTPTVQVFEALLQRVSHLAARTTTDHNGHTVVVGETPPRGGGTADGPELRWHVPSARPWCKWRPAPFFKWRCRSKNGRHFLLKVIPSCIYVWSLWDDIDLVILLCSCYILLWWYKQHSWLTYSFVTRHLYLNHFTTYMAPQQKSPTWSRFRPAIRMPAAISFSVR